jgi:hypothetical protein
LPGIDFTMSSTQATTIHTVSWESNHSNDGIAVPQVKPPIIYTIDDLLFSRRQTIPDVPLVAYPDAVKGKAEYAHYTARDLDRFADHGALKYTSMGLKPKACL